MRLRPAVLHACSRPDGIYALRVDSRSGSSEALAVVGLRTPVAARHSPRGSIPSDSLGLRNFGIYLWHNIWARFVRVRSRNRRVGWFRIGISGRQSGVWVSHYGWVLLLIDCRSPHRVSDGHSAQITRILIRVVSAVGIEPTT
jgi:hypothetical protein